VDFACATSHAPDGAQLRTRTNFNRHRRRPPPPHFAVTSPAFRTDRSQPRLNHEAHLPRFILIGRPHRVSARTSALPYTFEHRFSKSRVTHSPVWSVATGPDLKLRRRSELRAPLRRFHFRCDLMVPRERIEAVCGRMPVRGSFFPELRSDVLFSESGSGFGESLAHGAEQLGQQFSSPSRTHSLS
jgi:hypothetical protein